MVFVFFAADNRGKVVALKMYLMGVSQTKHDLIEEARKIGIKLMDVVLHISSAPRAILMLYFCNIDSPSD